MSSTDACAQKPPRYSAVLAGGQRIAGEKLADWHTREGMPRLENQTLLEAGNPLKWLRDRSLAPSGPPPAFVETHTGDRLPGTVVDFRTGLELPFEPLPPHVVVEPALSLEPPRKPETTTIRVSTPTLRRIVWQRRTASTLQPGTIFFRDGRSLSFRAIRLGSGFASVLLEDGSQKVPWSDLAEIHFPETDFWPAYFDELAGSGATAQSQLMQLETSSGLVATTSLDRFAPRFDGNPQDADRWVHGIQPAWSLDILWVPCREVVYRRLFKAHDVPLSRIPPKQVVAESLLGTTARPPQVNRSVFGGPLQNSKLDFGWGIGTAGRSELTFELPPGARLVRGSVALDRTSGSGGCIRARTFLQAPTRTQLWESPFLVGAETIADFSVPLAVPPGQRGELVLQIDPAHEGRPAGADPLDIRDSANWLDPLLELDPAAVQKELDARLTQRFFAWKDAAIKLDPPTAAAPPTVTYARNDHLPMPGTFEAALAAPGRSLTISREFSLGADDAWLVISAVRPQNQPQAPKLEVRIGNEPVAEYEVPPTQNDPSDVRPLALPLTHYQRPGGTTIRVEVRQPAADPPAAVQWRTFQTAPQLPTLFRVFEENESSALAAAIVEEDRHAGVRSLRVASGTQLSLPLAGGVRIRERPRWGEYRFLRFALRKKGKGRAAVELVTAEPRTEPARYDAGKGEKSFGAATRIWNEELPDKWIVLTRDLYGDFGSLDLESILLACPDGESVLFDHVYLARSAEDFNLIPAAPSAEMTNEKARLDLAMQIVERVQPAVVTLQMPDGRVGGGLIRQDAEILAVGHFLRAPNQEVAVRLADGKLAKGKALGISRELDLGLVKLEGPGPWPAAALDERKEIDPQQILIALTFPPAAAAETRPQVQPCSLRRFFRTTLWTDADGEGFTPGGALFDPQGKAVGIHSRRSQFGGYLFSRLNNQELAAHLERMRRGEVFGAWPAGAEPTLGISGKPTLAGLEVTELVADGPAAKAGIQRGDFVTRIGGKPVVGPDDVQIALSECDAGQMVAIEITRGASAMNVSATLAPREP